MPLPVPTLKADPSRPEGVSLHWAETEGAPDNGLNILDIPFVAAGIEADEITAGFLQLYSRPTTNFLTSTVSGFFPGVHPNPIEPGSFLSADKRQIAVEFVQSGGDQVVLAIQLTKTEAK